MTRPLGHGRQPIRTASTDFIVTHRANDSGAGTGRQVMIGRFAEVESAAATMIDPIDMEDLGTAPLPEFDQWWSDPEPPVTSREKATRPDPDDRTGATPHQAPANGSTRQTQRKRRASSVAADPRAEKPPKGRKAKRTRSRVTTTPVDDPVVTQRRAVEYRTTTLHRNLCSCRQNSQLLKKLLDAPTFAEALAAMKANQGNPANGLTRDLMAQLDAQSQRACKQFAVMLLANMLQFRELTVSTFLKVVQPHLDAEWDSEMEPIRRQAIDRLSDVISAANELNPKRARRREPPLIDATTLQELRNLSASWKNVGT